MILYLQKKESNTLLHTPSTQNKKNKIEQFSLQLQGENPHSIYIHKTKKNKAQHTLQFHVEHSNSIHVHKKLRKSKAQHPLQFHVEHSNSIQVHKRIKKEQGLVPLTLISQNKTTLALLYFSLALHVLTKKKNILYLSSSLNHMLPFLSSQTPIFNIAIKTLCFPFQACKKKLKIIFGVHNPFPFPPHVNNFLPNYSPQFQLRRQCLDTTSSFHILMCTTNLITKKYT